LAHAHPIQSAEHVLERLAGLPGGPELLAAAKQREDIALVGGAVRDLLLGHWPRELDVTVGRDAAGLATVLAASVSPSERAYGHAVQPILHERFGTASVAWGYGRIDIAERRAEAYPAPGALPDVRSGSVEDDLARRDFTVNALALALAGPDRGALRCVEGALDDLAAGSLRVLHDRSFLDDPTRLMRLARYAARLGFEIEPHTLGLARAAVADRALDTVSGGRIGAELWLAAREADGPAALRALDALGVLSALGLRAPFDETLAREAHALLPPDGRSDVLLMALAFGPTRGGEADTAAVADLTTRLEFAREQLRPVVEAVVGAAALAEHVARAPSDAIAYGMIDGRALEAVAIAGALAARSSEPGARRLREWLATERHVKLEIDGSDLISAGVSEGPEIGLRLRAALRAKREGTAQDRETELRAALDAELVAGQSIQT
jgi:tRNA nucleotidyltransferase (CCA-adding enzyme)